MLNLTSNIEANERLTRIIVGALLIIGLLLGIGRLFAFLIGIGLIAEGILGWSVVPIIDEKLKLSSMLKKKDQ